MTKRAFDKIAAGLNDAIAYANGDAGCARAERPVLASVHEAASALHGIGLVDDMTMREFDALCLMSVEPLAPEEIRALRERE